MLFFGAANALPAGGGSAAAFAAALSLASLQLNAERNDWCRCNTCQEAGVSALTAVLSLLRCRRLLQKHQQYAHANNYAQVPYQNA
jgi:hypothetical protein